jgi:hypothetical protein
MKHEAARLVGDGVELACPQRRGGLRELALQASAVILAEFMDSTNLIHAVLLRAAELLGGTEPLARRLHVSAEELTRWLSGEGIVDIGMLPRAIDVLLDPSPPPN